MQPVFRICNFLFLECSTDSLNLPMLFPADLVDVMSNSPAHQHNRDLKQTDAAAERRRSHLNLHSIKSD